MLGKVLKLIKKDEPVKQSSGPIFHLVVGTKPYVQLYVAEKWGDKFLYYFGTSQSFIPISSSVCFFVPKVLDIEKIMYIIEKNRIESLALEEKFIPILGNGSFGNAINSLEDLIIVSTSEKIKDDFHFNYIHRITVKESVSRA